MSRKRSIPKLVINYVAILQLLSWNVEAYWENNYTIIEIINSMNLSWTAGENPTDLPDPKPFRRPKKTSAVFTLQADPADVPDTLRGRQHWKECGDLVSRIRDQGECSSSWAVATVSMLSDRICIETNGSRKYPLSAEDVMTCCHFCKAPNKEACDGGHPEDAIFYWMKHGIVTGGPLNTSRGCKPYSDDSHKGVNLPCTRNCSNENYGKEYENDKYRGKMVYRVSPNEEAIKLEIFTHGPVVAVIDLYEDFMQYKKGIYRHVTGKLRSQHTLKIMGWGEQKGTKYWMTANSFGSKFGHKGFVRFLRGENDCGIEDEVRAGRMIDALSPREMLTKGSSSGANQESCFLVEGLLYVSCIWILKQTLALWPLYII